MAKNPIKMNTKPVYDPTKQYTWDKDAKFELTGHQFGLWLNMTRAKITSKDAMEYKLAFESNEVIENMMISAVREGVVIEAVKETK